MFQVEGESTHNNTTDEPAENEKWLEWTSRDLPCIENLLVPLNTGSSAARDLSLRTVVTLRRSCFDQPLDVEDASGVVVKCDDGNNKYRVTMEGWL
jgi:hypothetical protein